MFEFPLAFSERLAERSFSSTSWTLYGIDDEAPAGSAEDEREGITVPQVENVLTEEDFRQLRNTVDPLSDDDREHGCNLYCQALRLVNTFIG